MRPSATGKPLLAMRLCRQGLAALPRPPRGSMSWRHCHTCTESAGTQKKWCPHHLTKCRKPRSCGTVAQKFFLPASRSWNRTARLYRERAPRARPARGCFGLSSSAAVNSKIVPGRRRNCLRQCAGPCTSSTYSYARIPGLACRTQNRAEDAVPRTMHQSASSKGAGWPTQSLVW